MAPDLNSVPSSPRSYATINMTELSPAFTETPLGGRRAPAPPSHPPPTSAPSRPNILYIMADQLAAPLLKMYNPQSQIQTPHLDALASHAVVFDSAYCPSPLCAPSRMSMITGQLPSKIGSYDNANAIASDVPTYAHYLRRAGYETVLAGKMHFIGDQLHGYERRLTPDIYPADFGWVVNWDQPDTRLEWYHNASSILQAGPCVRSNQLDYDEEVMYKSTQFLYDHVRQGPGARPFCMTVSLTHPHDPYTIEEKYWDMYEDVEIELPKVNIPKEDQDPHSQRLMKVCDLWGEEFSEKQIKRARRAYYGAVSYVDDCIGKLLKVLKDCRLAENTIVVFSGDHGDMLGERGLWYKMSYFESSVRVPLLVHYPSQFHPRHVSHHVSTLDILPTLTDLIGVPLSPDLPIDGASLYPFLLGYNTRNIPAATSNGTADKDNTVFAEYMGEGTISPMMMIRRGPWKFIACPADPVQLYNLSADPDELVNLAPKDLYLPDINNKLSSAHHDTATTAPEILPLLQAFIAESLAKWDFPAITAAVLKSQRQRRLVWQALKKGQYTSWDFNPVDDGREKYIRSHLPLDTLELKARFPIVDHLGREGGGWSFLGVWKSTTRFLGRR